MRMDSMQLNNKNQLIHDYRYNYENISSFFDYHPFKSYTQRVQDLQGRTFKRDELANTLHTMNKQWAAPDPTVHNIERLKDKQSVVVIGGQQAGMLTGPLYTINKIISLIHCAKEQEQKLEIPVIPVFWIAGEDHDYDEINHIFLLDNNDMTKYQSPQHIATKSPISKVQIDQEKTEKWMKKIFGTFQETDYTKELYDAVKLCLDQSTTYVDFFARLIYRLFPDEGLVLIDSDDKQLRLLESDFFVQMIQNQPRISESVYRNEELLNNLGYTTSLELERDDAHLFVHNAGERILLKRDAEGNWVGKQNEIKLTTEAMLNIAVNEPHRLSNNVITRPLMQELLFPSLAFVGGDGEIGYWAVLQNAFHAFKMNMPPILPRLSITYISRNIESLLKKHNITASQAINTGVSSVKDRWFSNQCGNEIEQTSEQLKATISQVHEPLREMAEQIRSDIGDMAHENLTRLHQNINFLKNRMIKELKEKYSQQLNQFDLINAVLYPQAGLQERVWNILPLINMYGFDFLQNILNTSFSFEEDHYISFI